MSLKVVHLSTTDFGGAYKAAERIHRGMLLCGADSKLLVRTKTDPGSDAIAFFDKPAQKLVSKVKNVGNLICSDGAIITDRFGTDISRHPLVQEADVIVLHWVNSFVSYRNVEQLLQLHKKVIWVMHDMWLLTGGCHCDLYCGGYKQDCRDCKQLLHQRRKQIARANYARKSKMLRHADITLVGPSEWMVNCAARSKITSNANLRCIHNPIDTSVFRPMHNIDELRKKYDLPCDKKIVLLGATSVQRVEKGSEYIEPLLEQLDAQKYAVVLFGENYEVSGTSKLPPIISVGTIQDEHKMAELYSCADVFVTTSKQESFGYTVCEALSCGTPVVAFAVGGICDQIVHKRNGFLAQPWNVEELVEGIEWAVDQNIKGINLLDNSLEEIGRQYLDLMQMGDVLSE
jgi:glycosyltransferase involved in cell wall biosynthesis